MNNEKEMFDLMKKKLYTPVVGDILDGMGYTHQFLPPYIRPMKDDMKIAGKVMTVLMIDVFGPQKVPFGRLCECLDQIRENEIYVCTGGTNNKDVDVIGFSGCTDNAYAIRLLVSLIKHPNVGAVLAVGLGCEYVQTKRLADAGKLNVWMYIQNEGGTAKAIEKGLCVVFNMLTTLKKTPRVKMGFCDLVTGAECGGSDYTSGLAGNTVVGAFYDKLVDTGGTAVFEEIVEAVGLIDLLQKRAANDKVREELTRTYNKAMDYCKSVRQYSISPGNFMGGLSTIEEKSMGAFIKSGTKPIDGVLQVSEAPTRNGLWLLVGITNPNDNEGLMDLISCGAQVVFLVTGRGNVVGSAVAPVIKITGNHETFMNMNDDMDFDANAVLYGSKRLEECADELAAYVAEICGGVESRAESLGHKEYFIPYKYQNIKRCGDD